MTSHASPTRLAASLLITALLIPVAATRAQTATSPARPPSGAPATSHRSATPPGVIRPPSNVDPKMPTGLPRNGRTVGVVRTPHDRGMVIVPK